MPRKTKEEVNEPKKTATKKTSNSKKAVSSTTKKVANTKKDISKEKDKKVSTKKTVSNKEDKKTTMKKTVSNKKDKKTTMKKTVSNKKDKKTTTKRTNSVVNEKKISNKKTPSKKVSTNSTKKLSTKKQSSKIVISEYYDLPYRYNKTMVKVLAQTPNTLFIYWDISDEDRKNYIEQYGTYFFNDTKPVLIVHNKTKNYDFEVDINDFANSWYLHLVDSDCEYEIELGRQPINNYAKIDSYLPITHSNSMQSPNDHILLDKLSHFVYFKNVKTNQVKTKTTLSLLKKIGKISSIVEFYQKIYPEDEINFTKLDLRNPSSSSFFK